MKHIRIAALALIISLILSLSSCAPKITDEEAIAYAAPLLEASVEVNEIYFGFGLPNDYGEYTPGDGPLNEEKFGPTYARITADAEYKTETELEALAATVYSQAYCIYLHQLAFVGFSGENEAAVYPKYITEEDGTLTVKVSGFPVVTKVRTFDVSTLTVVKNKADRITMTVATFIDGEPDETIRVDIVPGPNGWKLDTPTY